MGSCSDFRAGLPGAQTLCRKQMDCPGSAVKEPSGQDWHTNPFLYFPGAQSKAEVQDDWINTITTKESVAVAIFIAVIIISATGSG